MQTANKFAGRMDEWTELLGWLYSLYKGRDTQGQLWADLLSNRQPQGFLLKSSPHEGFEERDPIGTVQRTLDCTSMI